MDGESGRKVLVYKDLGENSNIEYNTNNKILLSHVNFPVCRSLLIVSQFWRLFVFMQEVTGYLIVFIFAVIISDWR